jgi:hypothetical protein
MLGLNYNDVWTAPLVQLRYFAPHVLRDFLATCSPRVRANLTARYLPND